MRRAFSGGKFSSDDKRLSERTLRVLGIIAALVAVVLIVLAVVSESKTWQAIGLASAAVPVGVVILVYRQVLLVRLIAIVLGILPFASAPIMGMQVQWLVGLIAFYWIAFLCGLLRPVGGKRWRVGNSAAWLLLVASGFSYIATRGQYGAADDIEFLKWISAYSLLFILCRQSVAELKILATIFVRAVTFGALFALYVLVIPGGAALLNVLSLFGYQRNAGDSQAYFLQHGEKVSARLSGTYVDPNIAAMFFFVALILAALVCRGRARTIQVTILIAALAATLSRGGLLALATAVLVFVIFNRRNIGRSLLVLLSAFVMAALVLVVPVSRQRLLSSFGQQDVGAVDRLEAIARFPIVMSENWLWGLGWGRPEFRSASVSYAVNMVANAPLGAIYRGGLVAGVAFFLLLLVAVVASKHLVKFRTPASVAAAGMIMGFVLAIQTGYGVITIMPMTALMSVVLVIVVRSDIFGQDLPVRVHMVRGSSAVERDRNVHPAQPRKGISKGSSRGL